MPKTEPLPVPLLPSEITERAAEMADLVKAIEKAEERRKDAAAVAKAAIDEQRARLRDLAEEVSSGQAIRQVPVEEVPLFETSEVETRRMDTGEILRARPMTPDDRQLVLGARATVIELARRGAAPLADERTSADAQEHASARASAEPVERAPMVAVFPGGLAPDDDEGA